MTGWAFTLLLVFLYISVKGDGPAEQYEVSDDLGLGRRLDGIGGLSAGASSKLLVNYPEPQRSQILDYLFKPNFAASLQILKVEIGGDDQSTDGTESSHMHEEWDENYNRGYEWWLMKEAKKRNPDIKLWGLSWTWPGWVGEGTQSPYKNLTKTATYTVKWIQGVKTNHNLTIDYIGIWNEQVCNFDYILQLRKTLNQHNLQNVQIVACDDFTGNMLDIMKNKAVISSIYAVGVHYPGPANIPKEAIALNYSIWSSEDYSTKDDDVGAGCWARILNQNYAVGYITSTTAWNVIASYYGGLPYEDTGLMNAKEPWSGYYEVNNPIWMTAHTTQFTQIGYRYLQHGHGVGLLKYGGSYVSLTSKERKNLTIVIETLTHNHSACARPDFPAYTVQAQKAIFKLGGAFAHLTQMHVWRTSLNFADPSKSVIFKYDGKVEVVDGRVAMNLDVDSVYTLTATKIGHKGDHGQIPASKTFPLPYSDNFENYQVDEEPYMLSPQIGVWEIKQEKKANKFAQQVILTKPVSWCSQKDTYPVALIGNVKWGSVVVSSKFRIPSINGTQQVFLALRTNVNNGGCESEKATGLFFWLTANSGGYAVSTDIRGLAVIDAGLLPNSTVIVHDTWYSVTVGVQNNTFIAKVNNAPTAQFSLGPPHADSTGFVGLGAGSWGLADYDDLTISSSA